MEDIPDIRWQMRDTDPTTTTFTAKKKGWKR